MPAKVLPVGPRSKRKASGQRATRPRNPRNAAPQPQAALDPRLFAVIFDALGVAAAIAASAATGCSYRELRETAAMTSAERQRLQEAAGSALQAHADWLGVHHDGIALAAILSGVAAGQVQVALVLADASAEAGDQTPEPLSPLAAALLVLLILAPFIVLTAVVIHGHKGKRK